MVLIIVLQKLLEAFLGRCWSRWPQAVLWLVVDRQYGSRRSQCHGLEFLVIAFLLHRPFVDPLMPRFRLTRLREVFVITCIEGRGRVLARLQGVLLPACLAVDACAGAVVVCLLGSSERILLLHFASRTVGHFKECIGS